MIKLTNGIEAKNFITKELSQKLGSDKINTVINIDYCSLPPTDLKEYFKACYEDVFFPYRNYCAIYSYSFIEDSEDTQIEKMINKDLFLKYLINLGLGTKTGIDTYFEMAKGLAEAKKIGIVERATMSYGQGISMTQIQILTALNTVINNGKMMKPYLVDRIEDSNGKIVEQNKPIIIKKID